MGSWGRADQPLTSQHSPPYSEWLLCPSLVEVTFLCTEVYLHNTKAAVLTQQCTDFVSSPGTVLDLDVFHNVSLYQGIWLLHGTGGLESLEHSRRGLKDKSLSLKGLL